MALSYDIRNPARPPSTAKEWRWDAKEGRWMFQQPACAKSTGGAARPSISGSNRTASKAPTPPPKARPASAPKRGAEPVPQAAVAAMAAAARCGRFAHLFAGAADPNSPGEERRYCTDCGGTGTVNGGPCASCAGTGIIIPAREDEDRSTAKRRAAEILRSAAIARGEVSGSKGDHKAPRGSLAEKILAAAAKARGGR